MTFSIRCFRSTSVCLPKHTDHKASTRTPSLVAYKFPVVQKNCHVNSKARDYIAYQIPSRCFHLGKRKDNCCIFNRHRQTNLCLLNCLPYHLRQIHTIWHWHKNESGLVLVFHSRIIKLTKPAHTSSFHLRAIRRLPCRPLFPFRFLPLETPDRQRLPPASQAVKHRNSWSRSFRGTPLSWFQLEKAHHFGKAANQFLFGLFPLVQIAFIDFWKHIAFKEGTGHAPFLQCFWIAPF